MMKKHNLIITVSLIVLFSVLVTVLQSRITITGHAVTDTVPDSEPAFSTIETTVYYTPSYDDIGAWCSDAGCLSSSDAYLGKLGVTEECLNQGKSYCCIQEARRGFYEEVKCQGSGVYNGRVYTYQNIRETELTSVALDSAYTKGKTATGTDPIAKRTIAVNSKEGTTCYIPYGSQVYIDFGDGNEWNGWYTAEDTGSAFTGKCKIDVFAGVGKNNYLDAKKEVSGKNPTVWVYVEDTPYKGIEDISRAPVIGTYTITPSFTINYKKNLFSVARNIRNMVINSLILGVKTCEEGGGELKACIDTELASLNTDTPYEWSTGSTNADEKVFNSFVEGVYDCAHGKDSDCICSFSVNKIPGSYDISIDAKEDEITFATESDTYTMDGSLLSYPDLSRLMGEMDVTLIYDTDSSVKEQSITGTDVMSQALSFIGWHDINFEENIIMYKIGDSISFVGEKDTSYYAKSLCAHEKRSYRFNVNTRIERYIEKEGQIVLSNLTLKFAIEFPHVTTDAYAEKLEEIEKIGEIIVRCYTTQVCETFQITTNSIAKDEVVRWLNENRKGVIPEGDYWSYHLEYNAGSVMSKDVMYELEYVPEGSRGNNFDYVFVKQ